MENKPTKAQLFFASYDKNMYRIAAGESSSDQIFDALNGTGNSNAQATQGSAVASDPSMSGSGFSNNTTQAANGNFQAGKTQFDNTQNGYILGIDSADGRVKFYIGNAVNYFNWDGNQVTISGTITASSGTIGGFSIGATTISSTGLTLASGTTAYLAFGATPPTSPTTGTGIYLNKTGLFGLSSNTQNFSISATDGSITAIKGSIANFTLTSSALYAGTIKTAATVGAGSTGVIMDTAGLRGYDSVLGQTFNLPTDGSAPYFSSGIVNKTIFNIDTAGVLRTSSTVGDGTASSAGILINNTGLYGVAANQLSANANVRILVDGSAYFSGTFNLGGRLETVSDITKLAAAITDVSNAGGGTVALVPGTYNATTSFAIPSNVTIDGNGATIDFGGGARGFTATGANAYSTGTLAVNFGSGSVTGTGTTWTAGMVGQSILIGDYWYSITARASNTAITISPVFRGTNVSGVTYVIAAIVSGIGLVNITLQNNITNPLFDFRYCDGVTMDGLTTTVGPQGVRGRDSANVNWLGCTILTCTAGLIYNNVPYCTFSGSTVLDISGGTGIDLTGVTNTSFDATAIQNVTGVGLKFTSCSNLGAINFSIIECTSHGIECASGNSALSIDIGEVNTVGGDGIKLTASTNDIEITGNNILNCTGYGINIANANCNRNIIVANDLSQNNTSGALQDLGTSTKIRGNQGVSDNIVEGDLSLTDITTNNSSTSKHGFLPKLSNVATQYLDGTGAFSTPPSGGFPIQDVALGASSGATNFVMTSDSTGNTLWIATEAGGPISIYRLAKQTNSNVYYITHTTTQAVAGGSHDVQGLAIVGSSLYMSWTTSAVKSLQRFVAADLTSSTAMTISGTARDGAMWSDGTNLYIFNGTSSQFDKFTISGTTATNATTITYTSAGAVTSGGAISDGTSVWLTSVNGTINKYPIAGGASSATTTFILNQTRYPNNGGGLTMFLYGSNILGLGWSFTMSTNATDTGQFVHLSAVDRS